MLTLIPSVNKILEVEEVDPAQNKNLVGTTSGEMFVSFFSH